jgi:peptidoglycan/LPS O-acetylase OafA/YrhL
MVNGGAAKEREFFGGLEALRGLAALLVVFYHLPPWYEPLFRFPVVRHGHLMVNFFFVLSGFVLAHSYFGRIQDGRGFARFVVLRLGRLYPVHLVFLLVFVAFEVLKYIAVSQNVSGAMSAPFQENSPRALVECLLLIQALGFGPNANTFNFPSWSISTEFYTYLVFGTAVLMLQSKRAFVCFSVFVVAGSLLLLTLAQPQIGEFRMILMCWAGFFAGCLVNFAYRTLGSRRLHSSWSLVVLLVTVAFLLVDWGGWEQQLVLLLSAALIITLVLTPAGALNNWLSWGPVRWLGEISYSLYMCHAAVMWVARQFCRKVLHAPEVVVDGLAAAQLSPAVALAVSAAAVGGSLVLAGLTYKFIEDPCRNAARAWAGAASRRQPTMPTEAKS